MLRRGVPRRLLQVPRRARRDLRPGCRRLCCRSGLRRLLRRRRRGQQAPPRLIAGNAVHHRQPVLLLIVPYRGSRLLAARKKDNPLTFCSRRRGFSEIVAAFLGPGVVDSLFLFKLILGDLSSDLLVIGGHVATLAHVDDAR